MKRLALILLALLYCALGYSQRVAHQNVEEQKITTFQSDTLEVYFRQGYSTWEPNYMNNGERMQAFVKRFEDLHNKSRVFNKISKIHIVSGCSPEGYWQKNQILSKNRAVTIRRVLKNYITLPDSVVVEDSRGINWIDLAKFVEADPNMPFKEDVLDRIHNAPEIVVNDAGKLVEVRKLRLMYLHDGKPWQYMYKNIFPKVRSFNLQIVIEWEKYVDVVKEVLGDTIPPVPTRSVPLQYSVAWPEYRAPEPVEVEMPVEPERDSGKFYMAFKTNLLYDALITPNVGVEFYLGRRWSIAGNWMYAWWKSDPKSWYHRVYGGDLELRKYFGYKSSLKPLQGWHIGLYGQIVTYDFEWGARGYLGDRWSYAGGVAVGYSTPIAKRLNLDFNLGLGYLWGEYKEYLPIDDCYVWQVTKDRHWFGPTKAEVSLVWLIGRGNINYDKIRKGGRK
ncbi:MAG: DUF3575 domain-containing protein [Bacteroidales bacterium]|nr:DUF3575 domain-containing protein [Bacteroidales bacterium]